MPLKFCANLTFLFTEHKDVKEKYQAVKAAGFTAVEDGFHHYDVPVEDLVKYTSEVGIQHVHINTPKGKQPDDMGTAALPTRKDDFRNDLETAIKYAKALKCPRIHVLAGKKPSLWTDVAMEEVYLENINYAAERLEKEGLLLMLEPINPRVVTCYYMDCLTKALDVIQKVNRPNVKLQLDIFHLQGVAGDLTENIKAYLPYTDHIQVAQIPGRCEVSREGEINYKYIFKLLETLGYDGWVGLEYLPSTGSTLDSLKWMKEWGYA